jgi:hypothetical protein
MRSTVGPSRPPGSGGRRHRPAGADRAVRAREDGRRRAGRPSLSLPAAPAGRGRAEPGDDQESTAGLTSIADAIPWGQAGDHGSAQERIDSYDVGVFGGVNACLTAG